MKTPYSIRTLRIPDYVINLLFAVKELQRQVKVKHGEEILPTNFVFVHIFYKKYIGKPFSANYFSDSLKRELKRHKFDDMRLHDLRHSFGSNLLYQRVDIITVSAMMGHSSVAVTSDVYAHEIAELRAENEELINLKIEETVRQYKSSTKDAKYSEISPSNIAF